jgi:phospholipase C
MAQKDNGPSPIQHVFVLMLENRSFDHLFGFSGLPGITAPPPEFGFKVGASDSLKADPPHEYDDVARQLDGGAMTGFPAASGPAAMLGFGPDQNPLLRSIAENSLLMDNWFSSMPGPTWPNRFFAHAASSGGLDNSPNGLDVAQAVSSPLYSYQFDSGHIFDRLVRMGKKWRIYKGDSYPQVLALRGMVDKRLDRMFFRPFKELKADLAAPYEVAYTFIEPDYDTLHNYARGNSQHPLGSVSAGERLISGVYKAVFTQPVGARSVLLVTWDEHGGFFDHVPPPAATPPGDSAQNYGRARQPRDCRFDRFGPRVPALLLSPWLPTGLGSQIFHGQTFDHASIVSSLCDIFDLGEPLTKRDANAPSWHSALLSEPMDMELSLPRATTLAASQVSTVPLMPPDNASLQGTLQIAARLDWDLASRTGKPPLIASEFHARLGVLTAQRAGEPGPEFSEAQRVVIADYLSQVNKRELAYERVLKRELA